MARGRFWLVVEKVKKSAKGREIQIRAQMQTDGLGHFVVEAEEEIFLQRSFSCSWRCETRH
jgi:hypothetical protein